MSQPIQPSFHSPPTVDRTSPRPQRFQHRPRAGRVPHGSRRGDNGLGPLAYRVPRLVELVPADAGAPHDCRGSHFTSRTQSSARKGKRTSPAKRRFCTSPAKWKRQASGGNCCSLTMNSPVFPKTRCPFTCGTSRFTFGRSSRPRRRLVSWANRPSSTWLPAASPSPRSLCGELRFRKRGLQQAVRLPAGK